MNSTPTPAVPTTQQIRQAIGVIQIAVRDPHADPVAIATAHRLLVTASQVVDAPVRDWLNEYLDTRTTENGASAFCAAVDCLARNFKLPRAVKTLAPGEQGRLF